MWSRPPFGETLRKTLGSPRRVRTVQSSPRSRVWRAEVSGTPVVVKQLVDAPEADDRFAREVAALTLLAGVDPPVAPAVLGVDRDARVLVLEQVTHRPPGPEWPVAYAAALARLHAAGADAGPGGPGDAAALPPWAGPSAADVEAFLGFAGALGVDAGARVRGELAALVERQAEEPSVRSLLHGDPCLGNHLHTGDGVRFVDFEQASLGDGRVELAYLRIGFPTCWCVTAPAPARLAEAEAAYRTTWRGATGADLTGDLTDACAGWLLRGDALVQRAERGGVDHLARALDQDWEWGTVTARQRLAHRLEVVRRTVADGGDGGDLVAFGELAGALRTAVLGRWPGLRPPPADLPG